jgi:ABC-type bacteriocin/lantibiotic exporter with double-glycine peptidase domain
MYRQKKVNSTDTIKLIIIILFFVRYVKTVSQQSILVIAEYGKLAENELNVQKLISKEDKPAGESSSASASGAAAAPKRNLRDFPITGNIEFKNVTFGYPAVEGAPPKKNLDNVSFRIKPRDRVAFIGTNGSGKSTVIKLMCGFFEPTEGRILIDGVDMQEIDREYLRSKISVVSQKVVLFNRPVIDNICYATDIPKEKVVDILDHLKIADVFDKLPQGLNTMAGSRGENLSGGQRQIVYLLRSYLSNKPITIMDEPTAAVDVLHKKYVLQMIHEMAKKTTLIIVTHDTEIASTFSKKIHIESGRITRVEESGRR